MNFYKSMFIVFVAFFLIATGAGASSCEHLNGNYVAELTTLKTTDDYQEIGDISSDIRQALDKNLTNWEELGINESEFDKIRSDAYNRGEGLYYLSRLKSTSDERTAAICVTHIRQAVANNFTSWEKLETNGSQVDELYREAWKREPKACIEHLKTTGDYYAAVSDALTIRQDIAVGITDWKELGIKPACLDELVGKTCRYDSTASLSYIRVAPRFEITSPDYDTVIAGKAAGIRQAITANLTTWEKLGMNNSSDFDNLVKETRRNGIIIFVEDIKSGNLTVSSRVAATKKMSIEEAISADIIGWEELGMNNSSDFDNLVSTP